MTLFEECKEALGTDFTMIEGKDEKSVLGILYQYPFVSSNVLWSEMNYSDYENIDELVRMNSIKDMDVFVFSDDACIPVFKSNLKKIAENIHDVTSLSSKLFIFNDIMILQPLFPSEMIRLAFKLD